MMYEIVNVVYGIPITDEMEAKIEEVTSDPFEIVEEGPVTQMYHGGMSVPPQYCGVWMESWPSHEVKKYDPSLFQPNQKQQEKAESTIEELPDEVLEVAPEPHVFFIGSSS